MAELGFGQDKQERALTSGPQADQSCGVFLTCSLHRASRGFWIDKMHLSRLSIRVGTLVHMQVDIPLTSHPVQMLHGIDDRE